MQPWDMNYYFDGECKSFNDLIKFHRMNVDRDYPFEEWFNDHIEFGTIKPISPGYGSGTENRPGGGRRTSEDGRRSQRDHSSVIRNSGGADTGRALFRKLKNSDSLRDLEKYDRDLRQYEVLCQSYDPVRTEPQIKNRLAWYFRGKYYQAQCEWIPAERAFWKALDVYALAETADIISDEKIRYELLQIYFAQGNYGQVGPLLHELLGIVRCGGTNHGLSEDDIYCIYTIKCEMSERSLGKDDINELKRMLSKIHRNIETRDYKELAGLSDKCLVFAFASIMLLVGNHNVSVAECRSYLEVLEYIIANKELLLAGNEQQTFMWDVYELVLRELGMPEDVSVRERLKLVECGGMADDVIAETLSPIIVFYYQNGRKDEGEKYLRACLDALKKAWRAYVRDINDIRLYRELGTVQLQFSECYSVLRRYTEIPFAYEKVLQFKELASLAVRERNRIFHSNGMGEKLKLSGAHNEMAGREAEKVLRGRSSGYMGDAAYKRKLEADEEFYRQFPKNAVFTDITWEKVQRAIPDNAAVIEYFFCDYDRYSPYGEKASIDVYLICKKKNRCTLKREVISDGRAVLEAAKELLSILQKESAGRSPFSRNIDRSGERRKELLERNLHRFLIEPALASIQDVERLYIAPDRELMNLPFEILKDEDGLGLGKEYDVILMECARDFLFRNQDGVSSGGSLIIGSPQYQVTEREYAQTEDFPAYYQGRADNRILGDIPFSGVEACLVGRQCTSPFYTGSKAVKNLLMSAEGYRNIHIATHGYFDNGKDAAYASGLAFAGAENWLRTGQISRKYGNGIVTADEISRLNLRSVKLVVLSSCNSGMNEVLENKGFHGLLGGFSAAGARYVISSLWSADDFATAILMGYFYDAYIQRGNKPFTALKNAKRYIQGATIRRLKQDGWFAYMLEQDIDYESKQLVWQYEKRNDWERPFEREIYWGGFICYRCN